MLWKYSQRSERSCLKQSVLCGVKFGTWFLKYSRGTYYSKSPPKNGFDGGGGRGYVDRLPCNDSTRRNKLKLIWSCLSPGLVKVNQMIKLARYYLPAQLIHRNALETYIATVLLLQYVQCKIFSCTSLHRTLPNTFVVFVEVHSAVRYLYTLLC